FLDLNPRDLRLLQRNRDPVDDSRRLDLPFASPAQPNAGLEEADEDWAARGEVEQEDRARDGDERPNERTMPDIRTRQLPRGRVGKTRRQRYENEEAAPSVIDADVVSPHGQEFLEVVAHLGDSAHAERNHQGGQYDPPPRVEPGDKILEERIGHDPGRAC